MTNVLEKTGLEKEKKDLRAKLSTRLLSLAKDELKRRSDNVISLLSGLTVYKQAKIIMAYFPLKGEVNILGLLRKAMSIKRFCFPVIEAAGKNMRVFEAHDLDADFSPGPYGVMQPDTGKTKELDIGEIDMIIVPALAFDRQRNRLGRGAGFYDRFLEKIKPPVIKAGVAFEFQLLDSLPTQPPFDQKVDIVVTESSVI